MRRRTRLIMAAIMVLGLGFSVVGWFRRHRPATQSAATATMGNNSTQRQSGTSTKERTNPRSARAQGAKSASKESAKGGEKSLADKPLVGLFDDSSDWGCLLNAKRCAALRPLAASCDRKDIAACRQVSKELLENVPLDPQLAWAFLRKACDLGDSEACAQAEKYKRLGAELEGGASRTDALNECASGDGLACMVLSRARWAGGRSHWETESKTFCEMGWTSQCANIGEEDETRQRLEAACHMEDPSSCYILGLFHRERGLEDKALKAFGRACKLQPGHKACAETEP